MRARVVCADDVSQGAGLLSVGRTLTSNRSRR